MLRVFTVAALLASASLAVGCAGSTILRSGPHLGHSTSVATSADVRLVVSNPVQMNAGSDYVMATQVICSEPSPDVAKIVSEAFGTSTALSGKAKIPNVPTDADLKTTLALSKSYAEGVAQMTERLATIQLLRDGLYRACEAFANGAISSTTYSAMVSRYDKTMITLLMGELAAGNFGRSLAALSGTASSESSAELALNEVSKREHDAKENLNQKLDEQHNTERELSETPGDTPEGAAARKRLEKNLDTLNREITRAKEEHDSAEKQLNETLKAMAKSSASTTATAAGAIQKNAPEAASKIAGDLVQLQANYLNDHNVDAIKIACLNSFGREEAATNGRALSVWCDELVKNLEADVAQVRTMHDPNVRPFLQELFIPDSHAYGPYFLPRNAENEAATVKDVKPIGH
jgi:hypothetical protein